MTLVIAQKKNRVISFSSDSRISFERYSSSPFDCGIKVFSIPVKIYSPTDSETGGQTLDYDYSLGLAICGSTTNAYTIKESIYEILQNLQHIPLYPLSMVEIAQLVFNVFKSVSQALLDTLLHEKALCELVLGGYCPNSQKIRVFKFSAKASAIDPFTYCYDEILKNEGDIEFFGTGRKEAISIFATNNELTPLHIIKQVVKEAKVDSVGGALQYGKFERDNNFKIFGVANCELVDGHPRDSYQLRGMSLYKDELEKGAAGFLVSYTCIMPFEKEREKIFAQQLKDDQSNFLSFENN